MKYYVRVGDENQGPFTLQDLRRRSLAPDTYVWREGLDDWIRADRVPELAAMLAPPASAAGEEFPSPYASPLAGADYRQPPPYGPSGELPHSGFGVASFLIAIVVGLVEIGAIVAAATLVAGNPPAAQQENPAMMAAGCAICSGSALSILGGILGIVAVFQKNRKKVFGILGLAINGLVVLGILGLMCLGLAVGGAGV